MEDRSLTAKIMGMVASKSGARFQQDSGRISIHTSLFSEERNELSGSVFARCVYC